MGVLHVAREHAFRPVVLPELAVAVAVREILQRINVDPLLQNSTLTGAFSSSAISLIFSSISAARVYRLQRLLSIWPPMPAPPSSLSTTRLVCLGASGAGQG